MVIKKQEPWGYSVREERFGKPGFEHEPSYVYLIYIRFDRDSCLYVRHYWSEIGEGQTCESVEESMIREARPGWTLPCLSKLVGANFDGIEWKKKCYFTLFLDEEEWDFYNYPKDNENPIVFVEYKSQIIDGTVQRGERKDKNWSFFDAEPVKIFDRNAIRCINYKKCDADGTDNDYHTKQNLAFEIYLMAPFANNVTGSSHITIVIDPPGNNGGPP